MKRARDGLAGQREAAARMEVTDRWVRHLLRQMNERGDGVVVHGLRGRASNRRIDGKVQAQALRILQQPDWHDFGPTFASEQLAKQHGLQVGKETVRGWMIEAGLWRSRPRKVQQPHLWRPQRSCFGELVQWDASEHDWLEGRGEPVQFLETEYWPEWNQRFAKPPASTTELHRPLTKELDVAAILSHVESRVMGNDYTISFAGRRYQIARQDVQPGIKRRSLRVELRLDGSLCARYEGRYVQIAECGLSLPNLVVAPRPAPRKDHNAGGKSGWLQGFFDQPGPPLWRAFRDSNEYA